LLSLPFFVFCFFKIIIKNSFVGVQEKNLQTVMDALAAVKTAEIGGIVKVMHPLKSRF